MSEAKKSEDAAAQAAVEGRTPDQSGSRRRQPEPSPSAGPHAEPSLVNSNATPGAGSLPSPGEDDGLESTSS
jgi:hypothetical protein